MIPRIDQLTFIQEFNVYSVSYLYIVIVLLVG